MSENLSAPAAPPHASTPIHQLADYLKTLPTNDLRSLTTELVAHLFKERGESFLICDDRSEFPQPQACVVAIADYMALTKTPTAAAEFQKAKESLRQRRQIGKSA